MDPARRVAMSLNNGIGYESWMVSDLRERKSPQARKEPSFLVTTCIGDDRAEDER